MVMHELTKLNPQGTSCPGLYAAVNLSPDTAGPCSLCWQASRVSFMSVTYTSVGGTGMSLLKPAYRPFHIDFDWWKQNERIGMYFAFPLCPRTAILNVEEAR